MYGSSALTRWESHEYSVAGARDDLEGRSRSFGSALSGALRSAVSGGKGLDDVLHGLANRMTDIALQAGLKPLAQ